MLSHGAPSATAGLIATEDIQPPVIGVSACMAAVPAR
jgi:hypothetical protein